MFSYGLTKRYQKSKAMQTVLEQLAQIATTLHPGFTILQFTLQIARASYLLWELRRGHKLSPTWTQSPGYDKYIGLRCFDFRFSSQILLA
jgi:hypothetical protein